MAERTEKSGKTGAVRTRRIVTLAIAAVLILSMGMSACAAYSRIASPEAAEKVALEQLEEWRRLGILTPEVVFRAPADEIVEIQERDGGKEWYGRIFRHHYDVRWYFDLDGEPKYGGNIGVDTLSGKITAATLYAVPDKADAPAETTTFKDWSGEEVTWSYYDNFDDIIPADMSLDRLCTLLAEYWGFPGYRLGGVSGDREPPEGSMLLTDFPRAYENGAYVKVYFEGDPDMAPMYIELEQFPGHSGIILGTAHAVG